MDAILAKILTDMEELKERVRLHCEDNLSHPHVHDDMVSSGEIPALVEAHLEAAAAEIEAAQEAETPETPEEPEPETPEEPEPQPEPEPPRAETPPDRVHPLHVRVG